MSDLRSDLCSSDLVDSAAIRYLNAIVLLGMRSQEWEPDTIKALQSRMAPCEVIAINWKDYEWAISNGIDATLISDAGSLLRTYARCNMVVSLREIGRAHV